MKKIRFTTLYPECMNIDLVKDVGQIPYTINNNYENIQATLVGCRINLAGPNINNIRGLKIVKLRFPFKSFDIAGVLYLLFHSKKIDVLNVYHAGRRAFYFMKIFKFLNPSGKTYLKLDLDFRSCDNYDTKAWECELFRKNIQMADFVSVESEAIKNRIQKYSPKDIMVIGNGYYKSKIEPNILDCRNNTFITVGRLGTKQKATDILLEAFAKSSDKHDWNLVLIGSIEDSFRYEIERYYSKYPELKERVVFKGEITEREALYKEYCAARVFLLPSRWESWGLVVGEALSCGLRVIVSDLVPPMKEMTNDGVFGQIVPSEDIDYLSDAIVRETKRVFDVKECIAIKKYAEEEFSWDKKCRALISIISQN